MRAPSPDTTQAPPAKMQCSAIVLQLGLEKDLIAISPVLLGNRASDGQFSLPEDNWYHLAPIGTFNHDSGVLQQIDAAAVESMAARFKDESHRPNFPGVLVDFDHFSEDPEKSSAAAGWIYALDARPDGLWGQIRWSDAGEAAVRGGRYRLVSPAWLARDCEMISADGEGLRTVRPLRLHRVALTNDPNLKGLLPLSNRPSTSAPAAVSDTTTHPPMNDIIKALGLPADADQDAITREIARIRNRAAEADQMANRITELESQNNNLLETAVQTDLDRFADRIAPESRDAWKKALLANRTHALELLGSIPAPATAAPPIRQPIHNRAQCKTPDGVASDAHRLREQAVEDYRIRNRCNFQQAWEVVRKEKPDLFKGITQTS